MHSSSKISLLFSKKVVLFDGAMGTFIQKLNPPSHRWAGMPQINELLNITSPELITDIHRSYIDAGADVIMTNTFGANSIVLDEYGLAHMAAEINKAAVKCAHDAIENESNTLIALSVGPGSKLPTLSQISYDSLYKAYHVQIEAAYSAGIDIVIIETCQDPIQMKAAVNASNDVNKNLPVILSFTVEKNNKLLVGMDIESIVSVFSGYNIFALGINCGFGPDMMEQPLSELRKYWQGKCYLSANSGLPVMKDGKAYYDMDALEYAELVGRLVDKYELSAVGGCCGTDEKHIKILAEKLKNIKVPDKQNLKISGVLTSSFSTVLIRQKPAPTLIGERANATGSKAFRELLKADNFEAMTEIAKNQEGYSHVIDISVALAGRDETADMQNIIPLLNAGLAAPLMIDSTDAAVIEEALKRSGGKPVINSVNFEDGGKKFDKILDLVEMYPAAVVGLVIDEKGMAETKERKLEIAERLYKKWTHRGYAPQDFIIDFLTFSVAAGEDSRYAAKETLNAIKEFKERYPLVNTTLGVSNVSFGLSPAGRAVLNSVFLHEAVKAGLDTAIVHAEKIIPLGSIDEKAITICRKVINGEDSALDRFIEYFTDYKTTDNTPDTIIYTPAQELSAKVIKGDKTNIEPLITKLLCQMNAGEILNDILLKAMQELGELFEQGKVLLPFVLKSAEVMRECSNILAPYLKSDSSPAKGKVVLATVKGDVHDIGKNLVAIVLEGNGYEVVDLGTKVEVQVIIDAVKKHNPCAVGMSGLLVQSAKIMKENIEQFKESGLHNIKILLGGAALSKKYIAEECSPALPGLVYYCKDVFDDIHALTGALSPADTVYIKNPVISDKSGKKIEAAVFDGSIIPDFYGASKPFKANIADIIPCLRKKSLFSSKWGIKSDYESAETILSEMLKELDKKNILSLDYIYGYYAVTTNGNKLITDNEGFLFEFPYFAGSSLADYYKTTGKSLLPLQIVTLGKKAATFASELYKNNEYSKYYMYHGLFTELTETFASYVHKITQSGIKVQTGTKTTEFDKTLRFSFGYPYCPDLSGNITICDVLNAKRIGVEVNEGLQMEPEYTTCAFIVWHPEGKY